MNSLVERHEMISYSFMSCMGYCAQLLLIRLELWLVQNATGLLLCLIYVYLCRHLINVCDLGPCIIANAHGRGNLRPASMRAHSRYLATEAFILDSFSGLDSSELIQWPLC